MRFARAQLARLGHSSLRGLDREHFLQLVAAFPPILLQVYDSDRSTRIDRRKVQLAVGECQEQHDAKPSARTHS